MVGPIVSEYTIKMISPILHAFSSFTHGLCLHTLLIHLLHRPLQRPFLNTARQLAHAVLRRRVSAFDGRVPRALKAVYFLEGDEVTLGLPGEGETMVHVGGLFETAGADEGLVAFFAGTVP